MVVVIVGYLMLHTHAPLGDQLLVPAIIVPGTALEGPVKLRIRYPEGVGIAGHVHLLVDVDPPKPGDFVPMDEKHLHLMNFETETVLELEPGPHRLQLLFGTPDHRVPNPPVLSKPVSFTVVARG